MNPKLAELLESVQPEQDHDLLKGKKESLQVYHELDEALKKQIAQWLVKALTEHELASLIIRFLDMHDVERAIQFNGFDEISDNYFQLEPGNIIAAHGYICIADDPRGGNGSYFIHIEEGENPPVYLISSEFSDDAEIILGKSKNLIATKLSDIFEKQIGRDFID